MLRDLLTAATRAANAHNSQPWRFIVCDAGIEVHGDLDRHLGSFDPFRRELYQSLGCAIENLVHAARNNGFEAKVETLPGQLPPAEGDTLSARIHFAEMSPTQTALFEAISKRRTNRGAYTRRAVPAGTRAELMQQADHPQVRLILCEGAQKDALGKIIVEATREIVADAEMATDSAKWFRFTQREIDRHRDGLTLCANIASPLIGALARLFPPSAQAANRSWIRDTERTHVRTAALLGLIVAADRHERAEAIEVGRLWQRIHLWLTTKNLAAQPLNQPVERMDREAQLGWKPRTSEKLAGTLGDTTRQVAFVFRVGYPRRRVCQSPRRRIEDVLRNKEDGSDLSPLSRSVGS